MTNRILSNNTNNTNTNISTNTNTTRPPQGKGIQLTVWVTRVSLILYIHFVPHVPWGSGEILHLYILRSFIYILRSFIYILIVNIERESIFIWILYYCYQLYYASSRQVWHFICHSNSIIVLFLTSCPVGFIINLILNLI